MRHRVFGRKLNRNFNQRKALFRSLIIALVNKGRIKTTEAKAKAIRPFVDKIITKVKGGTLKDRRWVLSKIPNKEVVEKLFKEIGLMFSSRNSGFTRIIKIGGRSGDLANMVILEWVENLGGIEDKVTQKR